MEGGRKLLQSFIDADIWDEARVFTGRKEFGAGVPAPILPDTGVMVQPVREDRLSLYRNPREW